jgi:glycosyltransferase involved in cell wall biosynthesis
MTRVLVLMSTWNGHHHLRAQVESILAQRIDGRVDVLVRDDGSEDETVRMLEEYQSERVTVIRGQNLGAKASFLELVRVAQGVDADHYALADQDDVWLPGKLERAVSRIPSPATPALYCSSLRLVDEDLRFIRPFRHSGNGSFGSVLVGNVATGCTCVMTRALLEAIRAPRDLGDVMMHDWWIASIASGIGTIHYDDESFIDYRQHASSQIGIPSGLRGLMKRGRTLLSARRRPSRATQAQALLLEYGDQLPDPCRETLRFFLACSHSPIGRMRYLLRTRPGLSAISLLRLVIRV